ncbi:MAG: SAM-dependent methyltransferase [bacterium]
MHYFDPDAIVAEVSRLLVDDGRFLVSSLVYLPGESDIATATENLILQYNPNWGGAGFGGHVPVEPAWARGRLTLETFHRYVEPVAFTRESWRGRVRACRGVGASLDPETVRAFDEDHDRLLMSIAGPQFEIPHLITIHVFSPR